MSDLEHIKDLKAMLRRDAMARREALPTVDRVAAAQTIAARGLPVKVAPGHIVSGYSPLKSEISPMPLLRRCAADGASLALPVVVGRGHPLIMRGWAFGAPLTSGVWGIRQPPPAAPEVFPDILIVPLLAFDRRGHRIGYGAGYYDMTLAKLRAMKTVTAIGIAFAAQEVEVVPTTPRDAPLDLVLTEREIIDVGGVSDVRILFIGDIVGRSGRAIVVERLPGLVRDWKLDFVAINGENAAGGFGITEAIYQDLVGAGADAVTLGNHAWDQKEALIFIERAPRLIRPVNYPKGTPGRGAALLEARNGARVLVVNAMGRIFMEPLDDPFAALERELAACPLKAAADAVIVDIHAEASSEKQAMAFFLDGKVSLVIGTHTHVPTADHQVLPGGTAFMTDVGMTADYDSCIGMAKEEPLSRFLRRIPSAKFEPALGPATLCGLAVETDDSTGLARRVAPVRLGGRLEEARPAFWA